MAVTYPTPYTVTVVPYTAGTDDAHGNTADVWGTPVDHRVYAWAPVSLTEPAESGRDVQVTDVELYTPPGVTCQARDRVIIGSLTYEVQGGTRDYNHGFTQWQPGNVVLLRLVTG